MSRELWLLLAFSLSEINFYLKGDHSRRRTHETLAAFFMCVLKADVSYRYSSWNLYFAQFENGFISQVVWWCGYKVINSPPCMSNGYIIFRYTATFCVFRFVFNEDIKFGISSMPFTLLWFNWTYLRSKCMKGIVLKSFTRVRGAYIY